MAVPSFDVVDAVAALTAHTSPSFVFDVYDDAGAARTSIPPSLPTGPCNFVDLTHGSNGTQCGCRRFWGRHNAAATPVVASFGAALDLDQTGWCMCSHHACFHDQAPPQQQPSNNTTTPVIQQGLSIGTASMLAPLLGQENERPRSGREPLSPLLDAEALQPPADRETGQRTQNDGLVSFGLQPASQANLAHTDRPFAGMLQDIAPFEQQPLSMPQVNLATATPIPQSFTTSIAPSITGHIRDGSSIPDTLSCGYYELTPRDGPNALPSVLSSQQDAGGCLLPCPAPPSVASSASQTRYLQPFAGKGLRTLAPTSAPSSLRQPPPPLPPTSVHEPPAAAHDALQDTMNTQASLNGLAGTVQAHEQRLDKLENVSFSFPSGQEECNDRHDHVDMRVTELESRVDEVEKRLQGQDEAASAASGSIVLSRRRLLGSDDDATTVSAVSMAGTDASASMSSSVSGVLDGGAMKKQIQALQAQVKLLQSTALPTYNNPWELEVVFLPFLLKGVWVEASQFPTGAAVAAAAEAQRRQSGSQRYHPGLAEDEWTQMPNSLSRQTPDPQSPYADGSSEWPDYSAMSDAPRLLPRACAPDRVIDKRLRSCGLVQTVSVRGGDARSLQVAVALAFGLVLDVMASKRPYRASSLPSAEALRARFLGLQQPWVPLRKIHKDSRLRFLTRPEMLTPSLWDATFLASVVMKATGRQRLYVTHPDAYLQDRDAYHRGWSWQQLRAVGGMAGAADTADPSWAWDSRLDEPPSSHQMSPSPFSREGTPTDARTRRSRSRSKTPMPSTASASLSRSHRSAVSGSTQFFTAQSPTEPRSQSPFFQSLPPHDVQGLSSQLLSSSRRSRRPTPIRTVSMPAPPSQSGRPSMLTGASSSPMTATRRRVPSSGDHSMSSPSAHQMQQRHRQHAAVFTMAYERRSSPLASASRPSPRFAPLPSPVTNTAGVAKRRRTTRSPGGPSGFWPRYTPRRSMSRSPSVPPPAHVAWAEPQQQQARSATPFCYATPHSNAPTMDAPLPRSLRHGRPSATDEYAYEDDDDGDFPMTQEDDSDLNEDYAVNVYEDEPGEPDEPDDMDDMDDMDGQARPLLPEDEPWPGIEDEEDAHMSDSENMDPEESSQAESSLASRVVEEQSSQHSERSDSSQPSEYPSTHPAWPVAVEAGAGAGAGAGGAFGTAYGAPERRPLRRRETDADSGIGFVIHEDMDDGMGLDG